MPLSTLQQIEIDQSSVFNDTLDPTNAESSPISIEDDFNFIRSQMLDMLGTDNANWFDLPTTTLTTLKTRATLENKSIIRRRQILADITIGATDNFVLLIAGEFPTRPIAINIITEGAVTAQLAGAIGANSLDEIAGVNAINPKNLVRIVDASTGNPILSSGKEVLALLQTGSLAVDGNSFTATGNDQSQLSFVRVNTTNDNLETVPAGDIQTKIINYMYADRTNLSSMDEQDFDNSFVFTDQAGDVSVTLDNALDNQSGPATQVQNIDHRITDTFEYQYSDSAGAAILTIFAQAAGDRVEVGDGANGIAFVGHGTGNFHSSAKIDSDGQVIDIGLITGEISSVSLKVKALTTTLDLEAGTDLRFIDIRQTTPLPLTDAIDTSLIGPNAPYASLFAAINDAHGGAVDSRKDSNTTGAVIANTLIAGPSAVATQNLSADLGDYTGKTFIDDVLIFINGRYMRPGVDSTANNDVYPATVAGDIIAGAFFAEKLVKASSNIMMLVL